MSDTSSVEATNPILGSLKVSGANLNTIASVFSFFGVVFLCWVTWQHQVEAKDAERSLIIVMKENAKTTADALKESTAAQNRILEKMSDQAQRQVEAQRETNCLLGIPQDRRTNAVELCKRIAR